MNEEDRCTGHCCHEFTLHCGTTPELIDTFLRNANVCDGNYIADMLVPIRPLYAGSLMPSGREVTREEAGDKCIGWVFTCRHFNAEQRICTAYEDRPNMCREYPYKQPCQHGEKCTWSKGRDGLHPRKHHHWALTTEELSGRAKRTLHLRVIGQCAPLRQDLCSCESQEHAMPATETTTDITSGALGAEPWEKRND